MIMKAIRGATTFEIDCAEQIRSCVKELLDEIIKQNSVKMADIVYILFSNTSDLHSYYPAKAAREAGYSTCALFSALEPEIEGALKKCIRVMLLINSDITPKHVYLRGAKALRKDISGKYNIAIDGPAGSGKSTVCKKIAEKLDILCLDTGAMYRACALKCLEAGADIQNAAEVSNALKTAKIEVKYKNGSQRTLLNGIDVTDKIRTPQISMSASTVSAHPEVRSKMVELQRQIAKEHTCILDGRDIGSNVLPNAEFKFFLTAKAEVRAQRRSAELKQKGVNQPYESVLKEIIERDEQDRTRKTAPLIQAADAILIDNSDMNIEQTVECILRKIQEKI